MSYLKLLRLTSGKADPHRQRFRRVWLIKTLIFLKPLSYKLP
jgi:hypothetical protein